MPKIGRPRAEVIVTDEERAALVRLTKRARVNRAVAFRARIVLACIDDVGHGRGAPLADHEDDRGEMA